MKILALSFHRSVTTVCFRQTRTLPEQSEMLKCFVVNNGWDDPLYFNKVRGRLAGPGMDDSLSDLN